MPRPLFYKKRKKNLSFRFSSSGLFFLAILLLAVNYQVYSLESYFSDGPESPRLSLTSGYYDSGQVLQISHPDANAVVYYTLDGSPPSTASVRYSAPLILQKVENSPADISLIPTNPVQDTYLKGYAWRAPISYHKAMVIHAIACVASGDCSPPVSATYFVDIDPAPYPVISIIIDPYHLFDHHDGIYVPGIVYEENGFGTNWYGQNNANYFRRGEEWEIPSWFEFFEQGQLVMEQTVGVRIHGGGTRAMPMKSLRIYARSEYGKSTLDHRIFPEQQRGQYKRLILRNGGQDIIGPGTMMRDGLLQKMAEPLGLAIMDYRPAIVYLNGEYWGMHNIRERYDKHYFERKYHIEQADLDLLENNQVVIEGNDAHFQAMMDFVSSGNMADAGNFKALQTMMDTDSYIDYFITNTFVNNIDWPGHNLILFRKRTHFQPHAPWALDGRWRWALQDLDFGFGWNGEDAYAFNLLAYATSAHGGGWPPNPPWSTLLIRRLLENPDFKNAFISRFADLLNTVFSTGHILANIQQRSQVIEQALPDHFNRWHYPATSMDQWSTHVDRLKTFATLRPGHQTDHIQNYFGISGTFSLTLDVRDSGSGTIKVNRLHLTAENPLLEHSGSTLPWTGDYFNGIPFPVLAIPSQGYEFQKWVSPTGEEFFENPLVVNASSDRSLVAVFVESAAQPELALLHYWHFNDLPEGEFMEVDADYSVTGNAFINYLGIGAGFLDRVEDGTTMNAGNATPPGYALRARNPSHTRLMDLKLPTPGYENIRLSYAVKRTLNGAEEQTIFYRLNDASQWMQMGPTIPLTEEYQVMVADFSFAEASNNPSFMVRIMFGGDSASEETGNNRFDNIRLEGSPMEGTNIPPFVVQPVPLQLLIEGGETIVVNLSGVFTDDDQDPLTFSAESNRPQEVSASMNGQLLTLSGLKRGDAIITIEASDGHNPPVPTIFRALVYPRAFDLSEPGVTFLRWERDAPERAYPEHMLFLQSDLNDPGLDDLLLFPYHLQAQDYHPDDQQTIGFPYNNTRRTRINGLGSSGISFINTGQGRDLGGALLAVNTSSPAESFVSFLAGTMQPNSRVYNLRLQYRIGMEGTFIDVPDGTGNPVEYQRNETQGHNQVFSNIPLPQEAMGHPYVQLLWKYYFTGQQLDENSGQRTEIRLDDIGVGQPSTNIQEDNILIMNLYPNPAHDRITISIPELQPGTLTWQLSGIRGEVLKQQTIDHTGHWENTLDVEGLASGVYIIQVITPEGVGSRRFIRR